MKVWITDERVIRRLTLISPWNEEEITKDFLLEHDEGEEITIVEDMIEDHLACTFETWEKWRRILTDCQDALYMEYDSRLHELLTDEQIDSIIDSGKLTPVEDMGKHICGRIVKEIGGRNE